MDSLAKLIQFSQISGSINLLCQFEGDWFVPLQNEQCGLGMVHFVSKGAGYIQIGEQAPQRLQQGDLIMLPRSANHILSNLPHHHQTNHTIVDEKQFGAFTIKTLRGKGDDFLHLFCAHFVYEQQADLFAGLPEVLHISSQSDELKHILALLQCESQHNHAASSLMVDSLLQILLIWVLRRYMARQPELPTGILNGLQDKRLRLVLNAIVAQPECDWSVDEMAAMACVSRSQLMRLFKQHVGISPHALVNHLRLQAAAVRLRHGSDSVLQIALGTGFQSETHFGKAFKKQYGMPPGAYRKHKEQPE